MEQPTSRKGVAAVADAKKEPDGPPSSPIEYLELDTESLNGLRPYKGKFKFTVPTMGDRVDIGVLKAKYLESLSGIDGSPDNIAEALAYLNITLDSEEVPQWWKDSKRGIDLYDFQPLLALYAMARAYEATFLGGLTGSEDDADEDGGGPASDADRPLEPPLPDPPKRREVLASFGKGGSGTDTPVPGDGSPEDRSDGQGDEGSRD